MNDPESQQEAANVIEAWTNQYSVNAKEIPTGVYDEMMNLSADPNFIKVMDKGVQLPQNITEVLKEYTSRLQQKLSSDLTQDLAIKSTTFPKITKSQKENAFNTSFLQISDADSPRLVEVLKVQFNTDGSVAWVPIDQAKNNTQVRRLAQDVTRKYGARIGRLVRSYAHTENGDTNYETATKTLLGGRAFEGIRGLEEEIIAERATPQEKEGVDAVVDYIKNLPAIGATIPGSPITAQELYGPPPKIVQRILSAFGIGDTPSEE